MFKKICTAYYEIYIDEGMFNPAQFIGKCRILKRSGPNNMKLKIFSIE